MRTFILMASFWSLMLSSFAQNTTINPKQPAVNQAIVRNDLQTELLVELSVNQFELKGIKDQNFDILFADQMSSHYRSGYPDLPKYTFSIRIPNQLWLNNLEIISSEFIEYEQVEIGPSRGLIYRNQDPSQIPYAKHAVYNEDAFYPNELTQVSDPFITRGVRGESVTVYPFQYNPVTKVLRVYTHLTLKINHQSQTGINTISSSSIRRNNSEFENLHSKLFLNQAQERYTATEENGSILIIAHSTFYDAAKPYANWKRQRGIETELVNFSSVGTTAAQLKTYISNYYSTHNLAYVLLIGDNTHIPSLSSNGDSDQAYGQIEGADHYPEIFIGRFSVETAGDMATMVERTIWYERDITTAATWLEKATGIASDEGGGSTGDDEESDQTHMSLIRTDLMNYGYTSVDEAYQNNGITASQLSNYFNEGRGLINYVGHGDVTMWVTSSFNNTNVNALTNDYKLPFIFDVACVNGDFHGQTCFAEAWTRATNGDAPNGAVAIIASTVNQPWNPPMDGQDEMVDILTDTYAANIKKTFGGITYNGVMHMLDEYPTDNGLTADTWTIFGDPNLHVRTKTPMILSATHNANLVIGQTQFTVNSPVEGALVSLSKLDSSNDVEILGTGIISGGSAHITIPNFSATGQMTVTITAFNYIPYIGIVQVIAATGPFLSFNGYTINDAAANNNGLADNNETFWLNATISNLGSSISTNIQTQISTNSSLVQVLDNSQAFSNIDSGESNLQNNAYQISTNGVIVDQALIPFEIEMTDQTASYNGNFNLTINAPKMQLELIEIDDVLGNNNGVFDAGENLRFHIRALNIGHNNSVAGNLLATESSSYFNFPTSNYTCNVINATSGYQDFVIEGQVDGLCPINTSFPLAFNINCGGYLANLNTQVVIGLQIEDFEEGTFTDYPWTNTSSSPWVIVTDEVFEGSNASKSGSIANSQSSILSISLEVTQNDSISFYKKVSCEDSPYSSSNDWYDFLSFEIDNVVKGQWDGEVQWSYQAYPVTSGTHTFTWKYLKDNTTLAGLDAAWVDFITFPPHQVSTTIATIASAKTEFSIYPNPSNGVFVIEYQKSRNGHTLVYLTDISGKIVKNLLNLNQETGAYQVTIDGLNLDLGVYFVHLVNENNTSIKKLIIE